MKINITPDQLRPERSAYSHAANWPRLWIDGPGQEVAIDDGETRNGTPIRQWHGQARTIDLADHDHSLPTVADLEALINGEAGQALIARIFAGTDEDWNGSNMVGTWTDDAEDALEELQDEIRSICTILWAIQDADEYFGAIDLADEYGIDAATSDERIEELAAELDADALAGDDDGYRNILHGTAELLAEIRDDKRELLAEDMIAEDTGHTAAIEIAPAGENETQGPAVDVVLLDAGHSADATTVAYRYSTHSEDEDWRIGSLLAAMEYAADMRDQLARPEPADDWITISEAAALAGVTVQAMSQRATAGRIATKTDPDATKRQGRRLVRRSEVAPA